MLCLRETGVRCGCDGIVLPHLQAQGATGRRFACDYMPETQRHQGGAARGRRKSELEAETQEKELGLGKVWWGVLESASRA